VVITIDRPGLPEKVPSCRTRARNGARHGRAGYNTPMSDGRRGEGEARSVPSASGLDLRPSSRIIGIDLGTTNSCVAIADASAARIVASKLGDNTMPSVVAHAAGQLLVGRPAKAQMALDPRTAVYGSKRLVGRLFASPTVQACRDRFHYDIVEGERGAAAVRLAGTVFSMQQISSLILAEMRQMASEALGEAVTRAVITVPAYYDDHQRQAVREAGRLAGLRVERIVNEPTAAAVAYGYGKGLAKRVLVYDLGGGTFDASVVEVEGDIYEVVSTGGDTFLGGVDFDNQIVDHLVFAFIQANGFAPPDDLTVWHRIAEVAEQVKIALSSSESAVAHVAGLCAGPDGRPVDLRVTVTRAELEHLTRRLVDRTIEVCQEVLQAKRLTRDDLDEVLLVGGQSRMPLVWRRIREELGKEPSRSANPDEAVAMGAALLADADTRVDSVVLVDVLAMGIGVAAPGGRMVPVLPRNTRLPARRTYDVSTIEDGQEEIDVAVFQGNAERVTECEYLGTLRIGGLPRAAKGGVRFAVEFALGNDGILSVRARDVASGEIVAAQLATTDTPASLRERLQLIEPPVAPRGARPIEKAAEALGGSVAGATGANGVSPAAVTPPVVEALVEPGADSYPQQRKGLLARLFGR
jgi:molecular chaperone DnaK